MAETSRLRATLEGFREVITTAENPREGVSVEVRRHDGFQNIAATPSGHSVLLDEPTGFGGRGEAPDPAEFLLAAIGASLSVTLTAHASLRGIIIDSVEVRLSAEIDGRAFFVPNSGDRAGLLVIAIHLAVTAAASRATFDTLLADVLLATPVLRTLNQQPAIMLDYTPRD